MFFQESTFCGTLRIQKLNFDHDSQPSSCDASFKYLPKVIRNLASLLIQFLCTVCQAAECKQSVSGQ